MKTVSIALLSGLLGLAPLALLADDNTPPTPNTYGPGMMGPGYGYGNMGPGMMGPGYGPGYGQGMMGPGYGRGMSDAQRQQHWEQMQQYRQQQGMPQGGPGPMSDEQRQQRWEQMQRLRQEHGMESMPYPGYGQQMSPEQRQQHWEEMQQLREQHAMPPTQQGQGWHW